MTETIYVLCAATSVLTAILLFRMWRRRGTRLLLWSCLCFAGLAVNNVVLLIDLEVVPQIDLLALRTGTALASVILLLFGLVWEER
jgi:hypothetical protein